MKRRILLAGLTVTLALISAIFLLRASASGIRQLTAGSAPTAPAVTFTVNTTADAGAGSLRDAITQANATPGADIINFDIGTNTPTIQVGSIVSLPLPTITEAVTINGATGGATRVELNGTQAGAAANGLTITASNCQIRALVINRFTGNGISISGGGGNVIQGNFIGTDAAGTTMLSNTQSGVLIDGSPNNTIGGATTAARNLISGNGGNGVQILNAGATNNTLQGNFIGTNVTGTVGLINGAGGVLVLSGATGTNIGGSAAGTGNLISGNGGFGVHIDTANNQIKKNLIGTTANGLAALPNGNGIELANNATNNVVGEADASNIISGNDSSGVEITGNSSLNQIQSNFIGTDISGTLVLGNALAGVVLFNGPFNNTIGGTSVDQANVISANGASGVVISMATGNLVQGNLIGTAVSGVDPLGNSQAGVSIGSSTLNNTIGGVLAGAGNTIAFNFKGIVMVAGAQNAVLSNSIFSNDDVGIDLSDDNGITPNDACDADTGANELQNFPVLTSAQGGGSTVIQGSLNSTASTQFRIEFFSNATCDASGNGEGAVFIGSADVTTDAACVAPINVSLPLSVPAGQVITSTATDLQGNTSEFSQCVTVTAANADLLVSSNLDSPDPVVAGANITYTISFANNGPDSAQTVTVTNAVPANTTFVSATVTTGVGWSKTEPSVGGTGDVVFSKATVVSGETAVFVVVVKVNANTPNAAVITDNAVAASATSDATPGNNTGTAMTAVLASADLAVTKGDAPDPVAAGSNITYTINFVNNGPSDAQTVTVTDAVPVNTTFVSAVVSTGNGWGTVAPGVGLTGNIVFSKPTVAAGESAVFTIVVKVDPGTANGASINNTADAATATNDPTAGNNSANTTTTVQAQADLAVSKSDSPDPVVAGNNITYTVNFVNNGPSDAQAVTVTDAVPANTTFVSAVVSTGSGWGVVSPGVGLTGNVVFSKATVAAAESAVFTIVVNVNPGTPTGTTINNSAVAASTTADPTLSNNTGTTTTTVQAQADVAVTKTDLPDPVIAGNNITYTINFANNGPSTAANVTVTDPVPANATFVSAAVTIGAGWGVAAPTVGSTGNIVFSKGAVPNGETAVFTIVVRVNSNTASGTIISNSATAATASADPIPGNNTGTATTTVETQADVGIVKTAMPSPVSTGSNLAYTIGVTNAGPSDAAGVTVNDEVPPGTTFVSVTPSQGTFTAPPPGGIGGVTCFLGAIASGGSASITLIVRVNAVAGSTITNTASVTATTNDPVLGNNSSTVMTSVVFSPCSLNCPADVSANTLPLPFGCSALVSYSPPTPVGPCSGVVCTPPSNSSFPVGVTPVICTANGGASCSFNVTVRDTTAPRITCSGNITTSAPPGQNSVVVKYSSPPIVVDNCSGGTATCTPTSGAAFPVGTSMVTCTATDAAENTSTCSFSVTVTDSQAPTITCPSPVVVEIPESQCTAVVNYPPPTVTDNAPGTIATCAPPSGSTFPAGVTTVNCAAVDISGNRATCAFAVTVRRTGLPGNVQTTTVVFGGQTPVPPLRKAKNNPPASCDCSKTFTIPNNGCGVLGLNFPSISRTGGDVTGGRISDPDDSKFFSLRIVNPNGSESPFPELCNGVCIQIAPGQSQTFRVVFSPVIPRPSGKTSGLAASEVLPDTVTSKITFGTNSGGTVTVDLIGHVGTALQLINANKPKKAATASFTRSGDEFVLTYSVFDSNLDTTRARYELLDQGGAVVGQPIEVDLIQPIIEGRVSKGQSFVVEQRFPGARSHPEVTSVRLTVFDPESNDSLTAQLGSSTNTAAVSANSLTKPAVLKPRAVRLSGSRP